ncbi:bile acid:sodium symporter family protein [Thermoflavimicrobium dichotomicum]|uniref:Bile acid:Na+ symporter, BASS family n=1 Tax=Thermoflavimicrobium dichotomicum TaxID=46223 RepID=A0A1I3SAM6_9BACL|nr:bile acid:sodium symporter family protein [Thermoflavimicrobium dichotomicum]SFJ55745.1 bile acid:Na+ symporter, BASS family [Thermoflavimicrobium dichotomicum]
MNFIEKAGRFMGNTFPIWVLLISVCAFYRPNAFLWISPYITLLLGIVMFGMGLTLSVDDFKEVFRRPKEVAIGVVGHFIIMPLVAFILAIALHLPPDVAIGVILVGSCPSGTASNVMTFLAKGDVALAVSIASISTILSPIVTPFLIVLFAQKWTKINAGDLIWSIVQVVIIPIVLALIVKAFFNKQAKASEKALPLVSVIAIMAIVSAVVAGSQAKLAQTGLMIFAVVILHNVLGFLLGYLMAKLFKMDLAKRKAVTMEVGMQNSGLGVAIAMANFTPLAAVPSAIFSVWHNISGSILATLFSRMKEKK